MTDATDDPDLIDVIRAALAAGLGRVRTEIPARVVSYDATTQTITAQVVIRSRYLDENGDAVAYLPKPVANVPVVFPSGGGYAITWPLVAGDPVILVVCDRSIDEWKTTGQGDNTPAIPRRFDLSDAVAIPGGHAPAAPLPATSIADALVVTLPPGKALDVGGASATSAVALAALVSSAFGTLKTWLDTHTHGGVTAGPGVTLIPVVLSPSAASTASTRLKTDG